MEHYFYEAALCVFDQPVRIDLHKLPERVMKFMGAFFMNRLLYPQVQRLNRNRRIVCIIFHPNFNVIVLGELYGTR